MQITSTDHRLGQDGSGQVLSSSDQVRADSQGSFQVKFTMPPLPSGQPITITSDNGGLTQFSILPRITLVSPAILSNGQSLRIVGDGFRPSESIEIEFGDPAQDVKDMFPKETRLKVAQIIADREKENIEKGEYDVVKGTVSQRGR